MAALRKSGESDTGLEESEELMTSFYFPPSPPSFFPLYLPASPPLQSSPSSSYSGCLEKVKTRGNKEENRARIAILLEDILQTKDLRLKDAAKHLKVSIPELKSSCREYGIRRWPPRNEHKLIKQSLLNETPVVVDQEGMPQFTSHSNQVLMATVDKNSIVEKEILLPQLLPTAKQENPNVGSGNDEVEGTTKGVVEKAQLNSGRLGKGKWKEKSPRGDRRHDKNYWSQNCNSKARYLTY